MSRWEGKPAIGRVGTRAPDRVPRPCLPSQRPGHGFRCPKTCLQLKRNAWNVRLEAILCYFFLLENMADCQCQQPRSSFYRSCTVLREQHGIWLCCSLTQIIRVTKSLHGVICRRNIQIKTGTPSPSVLTIKKVCVNGLFIGCQVHQEPGAASRLRKGREGGVSGVFGESRG